MGNIMRMIMLAMDLDIYKHIQTFYTKGVVESETFKSRGLSLRSKGAIRGRRIVDHPKIWTK